MNNVRYYLKMNFYKSSTCQRVDVTLISRVDNQALSAYSSINPACSFNELDYVHEKFKIAFIIINIDKLVFEILEEDYLSIYNENRKKDGSFQWVREYRIDKYIFRDDMLYDFYDKIKIISLEQ